MLPFHHLYLHIPFCKHKCGYCDFNAYAGMDRLMPDYVGALERELSSAREQHSFGRLETVYLGGGTPSTLEPEELRALLDSIPGRPWIEATLEVAPGTITWHRPAQAAPGLSVPTQFRVCPGAAP